MIQSAHREAHLENKVTTMNKMKPRQLLAALFPAVALVASCATPSPISKEITRAEEPAILGKPPTHSASAVPSAQNVEHYKRDFAQRVVRGNRNVFEEPLPKMLKSVVVLDVTIDRDGKVAALSVRRSNGYKDLEKVAMNSVRDAAPFQSPSRALGRRDGSINFLETFLFRDDGRFQVRTLAEAQS